MVGVIVRLIVYSGVRLGRLLFMKVIWFRLMLCWVYSVCMLVSLLLIVIWVLMFRLVLCWSVDWLLCVVISIGWILCCCSSFRLSLFCM